MCQQTSKMPKCVRALIPLSSHSRIFSVKFCKLTIDTTLKSSDGELFGAHQRNLETYSDSEEFPIDGSATTSDPVCLEETADVVLLMLQFMHQIRQPTLDNISFSLLASLADAAEKYRIYSAMGVCKIKMMFVRMTILSL